MNEIETIFMKLTPIERQEQIARLVNINDALRKVEKNIDKIAHGKTVRIVR